MTNGNGNLLKRIDNIEEEIRCMREKDERMMEFMNDMKNGMVVVQSDLTNVGADLKEMKDERKKDKEKYGMRSWQMWIIIITMVVSIGSSIIIQLVKDRMKGSIKTTQVETTKQGVSYDIKR